MQGIEIGSDTLSATIIPFGASLADLRLASVDRPLVLGFRDLDDFRRDRQFMGAVIGRYANRISNGHARVGDTVLSLDCNENGTTHLHGGADGFAWRDWDIEHRSDAKVTLSCTSPDGEAGYTGKLRAVATYQITGTSLSLTLEAATDKDTIVNLCHHPYFNFDGHATIAAHLLQINTSRYLPSDAVLIPTGDIAQVNDKLFDFQKASPLPNYDFNNTYCLHDQQTGPIREAACLSAGGVTMDLSTTQPGLHLYNGYKLQPTFEGLGGGQYAPRAGLCLEAQAWPNSPNIHAAPPVTLSAGAQYRQVTEYTFSHAH